MAKSNPTRISRWASVGLLLIFLTAVGAAAVILVSQTTSAHSIRALSTDFMEEIAARARVTTLDYLAVGPRALEVIRQLAVDDQLEVHTDSKALERLFLALLKANEELEMLNYGESSGDFMMVKRMPDGSFSTKRIHRREGIAESTWSHQNPNWASQEVYADRSEPAAAAYDPRPRPWYRLATESGDLSWTEPYIFYSDRMPGLSCALPLVDSAGRPLGIVAAEFGISEVSRLLSRFRIGRTGQAMILTADSRIIASSGFAEREPELAEELPGGELVLRRIESDTDPISAAALARRPSTGDGAATPFVFDYRSVGYVARFESFPVGSSWNWIAGVVAPQSELLGSLRRGSRFTLGVTLLSLVAGVGLAAVLIYRAARLELQTLERRVEERTAELRASQAELVRKERLAALGQLTATVSHELRNPLGAMRPSLYLIRRLLGPEVAEGPPSKIHQALERVERGIKRCDHIIDDLLDFTRVKKLELRPTQIDPWLASLLDELTVPEPIELQRDFAAGDQLVALDAERFRRAVINVFENGCQAMLPEDSDRPASNGSRLTVSTRIHEDRLELAVADTGPGIPPEVLPRIFEPLFSTKGFGVGLGLPTARQIVEQHGGRIEIEATQGRGTRVLLCLPSFASPD